MSDHDAFLRAIRAQPDDDTRRLVFADWLDDHDQPERAEFVRVQIELAPIRDQLESPRVMELRARETELLAEHRDEWLGSAADIEAAPPAFGPVFRRGFPEMVCLSEETFRDRCTELFAEHPTLYEVALYGLADIRRPLRVVPGSVRVHLCEVVDFAQTHDLLESLGTIGAERFDVRAARYWLAPHEQVHDTRYTIEGRWPRLGLLDIVQAVPRNTPAFAALTGWIGGRIGRSAVRLVKPYERRFPITGGKPEDVDAGWEDGRPVFARQLLAGHSGGWPVLIGVKLIRDSHLTPDTDLFDYALIHAAIFDAAGRLSGQGTYPLKAHKQHTRKSTDKTLGYRITEMLRSLDFEPGLIRVREFEAGEGMSLRLWPQRIVNDYLDRPYARPGHVTAEAWRTRGGEMRRWLHEGKFVVLWDDAEFVFDDAGRIVPG